MQRNLFKTITILALLILTFNISVAQSDKNVNNEEKPKKENPINVSLYGFVRNDFTFDSRQNLAAVGELFYFIPLDEKLNSLGEDLNAIPNARFLSIVSRFGIDAATTLNNCEMTAKIETDFCGAAPNIVTLRIRHAYINFLWDKQHRLLVGQAWHPMSDGMLPSIVSLNTGAPFNPFSRAPQIRYDYLNNGFELTASATYQLQYTSPGPDGASTKYQVFGGYPEMNIGVSYKKDGLHIGLMGNYLGIKPRTIGKNNDNIDVKVTDFVNSYSSSLYAAYTKDLFSIKARSILGQNLGHILMMSGYGVSNTLDNGSWEYSSLTQSSSWINMTYGKEYLFGIFGGYVKNLGTTKNVDSDKIYCRGANNIDQILRVSPSFRYNIKNITVGVEYEYTGVMYGKTINTNATVSDTHLVGNHRAYAMLVYSFRTK